MIKQHKSAFTLAEALITMAILGMVLAATMPIVVKSQNSPSEAPWKYIVRGALLNNAAVYSAVDNTAIAVLGDKRVPFDQNISSSDIATIFATQLNPKLAIITRAGTQANPVVSRHLIDFYEKTGTTAQYKSIGKMSFDSYYNLAMGLNSLDIISQPDKPATEDDYRDGILSAIGEKGASYSGVANTAVGQYSMAGENTVLTTSSRVFTGSGNTALGSFALRRITEGNFNTAIGLYALEGAKSSENATMGNFHYNTAVGGNALRNLQSGASQNTAVGFGALVSNTTASFNTAIGTGSLLYNTSGKNNTSVGNNSFYYNQTGAYNTVIGNEAASNQESTANNLNIVIGSNSTVNGSGNIIIGNALNAADSNKLYIGGYSTLSASNTPQSSYKDSASIIYGDLANRILTFNSVKTYIGVTSENETSTPSEIQLRAKNVSISTEFSGGKIVIGKDSGSVYLYSGNSNNNRVATLGDIYNITMTTSDARLKNISGDSSIGLNEIMQLKVKNYTMKNDKKKTPKVGVIAQELQKIFPHSVSTDARGYLRISREEIFWACVNAIKELNNKIQDIVAKISGLDEKIRILESQNKVNEDRLKELEHKNKLYEDRLQALEFQMAKQLDASSKTKMKKSVNDAQHQEFINN
jgi:hypothetical protein